MTYNNMRMSRSSAGRRALWAAALLGLIAGCDESPRQSAHDGAGVDAQVGRDAASDGLSTSDAVAADAPRTDLPQADAAPPPTQGPLVGLPSPVGPHVAKIKALKADQWLKLGSPKADPTWGRARGRSWGGRALILAPDIRGAFFTGEGVHAFVKPDGHVMDDIWVYDINAHAWIAVHPGTETKTFNQKVSSGQLLIDKSGQLVDASGQPIPVHLLIHAWDFLSYDPGGRRFAMLAGGGLGRYFLGGEKTMDQGLKQLEAQKKTTPSSPMSPWFYDVAKGRFERYPVPSVPSIAKSSSGYPFFHYLPGKKKYVVIGREGAAYFDPAAKAWSVAKDSGTRPKGYDHGGAHDPKRERIYLGPGSGGAAGTLFIYDLKQDAWSQPSSKGTPPQGLGTNSSSVFYDAANDVVVVFRYNEKKIFSYAPAADTWTSRPFPAAVLGSVGYPSFNAFYDPSLNAYFCFVATDSKDNGVMWAYRYK